MKERILICAVFLLFILVLNPLFLAQGIIEPCHYSWKFDPNEDSVLNIADAIFILQYLFSGGKKPFCLETSDFNGDKSINIADAISILNWLFAKGAGPKELTGPGIDDSPTLTFLYNVEEPLTEGITEVETILPMTLSIIDFNDEDDIVYCKAVSYKLDESNNRINSGEIIIETEWDNVQDFSGNNILKNPFDFLIGPPNLDAWKRYEIEAVCKDKAGQEGKANLIVKTLGEGEKPVCRIEPKREDSSSSTGKSDRDSCCGNIDTNELICLQDCDYNSETQEDGLYIPKCEEFNGILGNELGKWSKIDNAACNIESSNTDDADFVIDYSKCSPKTKTMQTCKVKSMTVLIKSDDLLPKEFKTPKFFLETVPTKDGVGYGEGLEKSEIIRGEKKSVSYSYRIYYSFYILAELEAGSNPDLCFEYQFVQLRGERENKEIFIVNTKGYMYPEQEILYEKRLLDMEISGKLLDFNNLEKIKQDLPAGECSPDSKMFCIDDYKDVHGMPGNNKEKWDFYNKIHFTNKIIWRDTPGSRNVYNGDPSLIGTAEFSKYLIFNDFKYHADFISIVEDSDANHRFVCKINNLKIGRKDNKPELYDDPECYCLEQTWQDTRWVDGNMLECH